MSHNNTVTADVDAAVVKNEEKYIPTIDLRAYFEPESPTSKAELCEQVRRACLDHGFFQGEESAPLASQVFLETGI